MCRFQSNNSIVCGLISLSLAVIAARGYEIDENAQARRSTTSDTQMVEVRFNVTDNYGRVVTGIAKNAFTLFEDGEKRNIEYFSDEKSPITIGIVFALSDSTSNEVIDSLDRGFTELLSRRQSLQDDLIIIETGPGTNKKLRDYGLSTLTGQQVPVILPKAKMDVFESCSMAIDSITKHSKTSNPILLLVTDKLDNKQLGVSTDFYKKLTESDVTFYTLGISGKNNQVAAFRNDDHPVVRLAELASLSGGASRFTARTSDIVDYLQMLSSRLEYTYTVRFTPSSTKQKDDLYRIRIKIHLPDLHLHLMVRNKEGLIWGRKR